jgi:hypothetical protein
VKRPSRRRSCEGKVRHDNPDTAHMHLTRRVSGGATPYTLHAYRCRHCSGWHVGHKRRGGHG